MDLSSKLPRKSLVNATWLSLALLLAVVASFFISESLADCIRWSIVIGIVACVGYIGICANRIASLAAKTLHLPFALARDAPIFELFQKMSHALQQVSAIPDPVFRANAIQRLYSLNSEMTMLGQGTLSFQNTELWRIVYEQLLSSKVVYQYRSVSWIRGPDYWQEEPGRKSLQANFALVAIQQLSMQRLVIISDLLWPNNQYLPDDNQALHAKLLNCNQSEISL